VVVLADVMLADVMLACVLLPIVVLVVLVARGSTEEAVLVSFDMLTNLDAA
jgi:hypothetical protein